jgi:hypothetical protein
MSRWFRFYDDTINNPKALKLTDKSYRAWIGLLCIASKNDGKLPSIEDCALVLRMQPERLTEAVVALVGAELLNRDGDTLSPSDWNTRQYKSDTSTERSQRCRQQQRAGVSGQCNVAATVLTEQNKENRTDGATAALASVASLLVEVTDEQALAAWDAYGRATTGKAYPRNRRGGWRFPTQFPPIRVTGRTA